MKNLTTTLLLSIILFCACDKNVDCELNSREITEQEKLLIPYAVYDTSYFISNSDTFWLSCISKEYYQNVDLNADRYYSSECDGGQKTYYWELNSQYASTLPFDDTSTLSLRIKIKTHHLLENESRFEFTFLRKQQSSGLRYTYSLFAQPFNQNRLFDEYNGSFNPYAVVQAQTEFAKQRMIDGKMYHNVNMIYGELSPYDTIYYSSTAGIIRIVKDGISFQLLE